MSKNTIYKHFQSRKTIAKSLVKRLQQQLNTGLLNIEKENKDPLKIFSSSVFLMRKQLDRGSSNFFLKSLQNCPAFGRIPPLPE